MAANDLYSLSATGALYGSQVVNVWGFRQFSSIPGFMGQVLIDEWQASCQTAYTGCFPTDVVLNMLRARAVWPDTHQVAEEAVSSGGGGMLTGDAGPNQVAAIITWRTALAGRAYRGRTYLPGISTGHLIDGQLNSTYLSGLNGFIIAMMGAFGPSGSSTNFQLVVISRWLNKVERPNPIGTQVTAGVPRSIPGTQRRRRIGVGA